MSEETMRFFTLIAAFSLALPSVAIAQQSAPSSNPAAHAKPATSPNQPVGSAMVQQGHVKPCGQKKSGTSDRNGGTEKTATASGGANSNPNGATSGCSNK